MSRKTIHSKLDEIVEALASIEHERWSHWQNYMHSLSKKNADGSLTIPVHLVEKWERQINTDYTHLTEREKQSDRDQVQRYLQVIKNALIGD